MSTDRDGGGDEGDDGWEPTQCELRDGETTDESSHAGKMVSQRRQLLEDDSLPEDVRQRLRDRLDEEHESLQEGDNGDN